MMFGGRHCGITLYTVMSLSLMVRKLSIKSCFSINHFDFSKPMSITIINKKFLNQIQDLVMIKNDQEKNKIMQVKKSISSKKPNIIK